MIFWFKAGRKGFNKQLKTLFLFKILPMKKVLALIVLLGMLTGCDDGDVSFKNFNFPNATVSKCADNNIFYKTNGTEAMILQISAASLYNIESEMDAGGERIARQVPITATGANTITYRNYDGPANTANLICNSGGLAPTNPTVVEEWKGEGTITIVTQKNFTDGKLTNYIHTITLEQITFNNGSDESIRINNNLFGSYNSPLGYSFNYATTEEVPVVRICEEAAGDRLYRTSGQEVIILNFPDNTFQNVAGTMEPIELSAENENFEVLFTVYSTTANSSIVCNLDNTVPVTQRWRASSGFVIIVTTEDPLVPGTFSHEIRLKDVEFTRIDITTGETFEIYELLSTADAQEAVNNGGFLLGAYVNEI